MFTDKCLLLKTCTALYFAGIRIKRLTHRLDRAVQKGALSSARTVRTAASLERANNRFSRLEHRAIRLFLRLSAQQ